MFNILFLFYQIDFVNLYHNLKIKYIITESRINKDLQKDLALNKEPLVSFFNFNTSLVLAENKTHQNGKMLNINSDLVLKPGFYKWGGGEYDLQKEGYYNMIDFRKEISRNFIVYDKDILSLLSSISWLHTHGAKDNVFILKNQYEKIKTKKLSLTCGYVSIFASNFLNKYNIANRIVDFLTMDEWNTYDNGHTMLEVKIKGNWLLFDIDNNRYFVYKGRILNVKSFLTEEIDWQKVKYKFLSTDHNLDTQNYSDKQNFGQISYHALSDRINNDLTKWYQRVMQVPIIRMHGSYYTSRKNYSKRLLRYHPELKVLPQNVFIQKFYADANNTLVTKAIFGIDKQIR